MFNRLNFLTRENIHMIGILMMLFAIFEMMKDRYFTMNSKMLIGFDIIYLFAVFVSFSMFKAILNKEYYFNRINFELEFIKYLIVISSVLGEIRTPFGITTLIIVMGVLYIVFAVCLILIFKKLKDEYYFSSPMYKAYAVLNLLSGIGFISIILVPYADWFLEVSMVSLGYILIEESKRYL